LYQAKEISATGNSNIMHSVFNDDLHSDLKERLLRQMIYQQEQM